MLVSELGKVEKYIMYSLGESDFFFIIRENERANQVKDAYFLRWGSMARLVTRQTFKVCDFFRFENQL